VPEPKPRAEEQGTPTKDDVAAARDRMKKRFTQGKPVTPTKPAAEPSNPPNEEEELKPRVWHTISEKLDKKALDKYDMSSSKNSQLDLKAEMDKYLGGDDEVL
jgi:hypothetical protein